MKRSRYGISFSLTAAVSFFVLPVRWALLLFSGLAELQTERKRGSIQFLQNLLNQSHSHMWSTRLVCSSTSQRGMNNISICRCCTQQLIDGRWHEKNNNSEEAKSRVSMFCLLWDTKLNAELEATCLNQSMHFVTSTLYHSLYVSQLNLIEGIDRS